MKHEKFIIQYFWYAFGFLVGWALVSTATAIIFVIKYYK